MDQLQYYSDFLLNLPKPPEMSAVVSNRLLKRRAERMLQADAFRYVVLWHFF